MAAFSYSKWLDRRAVTFANEIKEKIKYVDPTGVEPPLKIVLQGSADGTDESVAELIERQIGKIPTKQSLSSTETGGERTRQRPYTPAELAALVRARRALFDAIANGDLDEEGMPTSRPNGGAGKNRLKKRIEAEPSDGVAATEPATNGVA